MILADTSVWIEFFRGKNNRLIQKFRSLLDDDQIALTSPVRIEILSGTPKNEVLRIGRLLAALPIFYPEKTTWSLIEKWVEEGKEHGDNFGVVDLLIAGISQENNLALWSLDSDFGRMKKLGWVNLFAPQA
ncbi:MAG: PIN domain-containing protein [Deltaproteobacteria bacterium]|nr:PIN domain-containing protein [Deltaproteobacteria bacterium]